MNDGNLARQLSAEERQIVLHGEEGFEGMRRAGRLAAETLDFITPHVTLGVSTEELDRLCHDFIVEHGAVPAPLGYRGYPKSICTSINHVVCHGIPNDKPLREGESPIALELWIPACVGMTIFQCLLTLPATRQRSQKPPHQLPANLVGGLTQRALHRAAKQIAGHVAQPRFRLLFPRHLDWRVIARLLGTRQFGLCQCQCRLWRGIIGLSTQRTGSCRPFAIRTGG